ncbi:helix-turn-helix transcriptional regulator [Streptomyces sp. ACA25]|uniref:helix-turn-helix domain-containing protein n=1 Tax=Streptomyces sp. ACA25 TaxID=3022596 RepID=UPI002307F336|nr:helix-turn-helix transcriptional regulator [Streptomyces sp. ACA25]MDB1090175.1 helix-turn-helix transcriptional regulator [Streptomyces sp. ACA25]
MSTRTTTRRRQLGSVMRKLRARSKMTLEEAGQIVDVSKATISRYETQEGPVKWPIIDALCMAYGASDAERRAVVALAKDAKQQGWWSSFADAVPETLNLLLTLEDEATREDHFACMYIPGLLQIRSYTEAIQQANERRLAPEELRKLVDIRMKRQEILTRESPPHLWAVLDESVLRRVVGSKAVMREQLAHLLKCCESTNVTLQVLPFAKGAHTAALGSFVIIGGVEPPLDVVYVDFHTGSLFLEKEVELTRYRLAFDYLRAQALDTEASSSMIERAREDMK